MSANAVLAFEWDKGNVDKNQIKHGVANREAEEVFMNELLVSEDVAHSIKELRFQALGETDQGKLLLISFTIRGDKVRILSARPMNKKEVAIYETKKIPNFENEDEEREFWATHDSTEYIDWSKAERVIFPNLKPSTESISLRLPKYLLAYIKQMANSKDVPYQSLIKIFLADRVKQELDSSK